MIKDFLKDKNNIIHQNDYAIIRKKIICNDGFKLSVQASNFHYCIPKKNLPDVNYMSAEVMIFSDEPLLKNCPYYGDNIYTVKLDLIDKILEKHGGIKETF